MSTYTKDTAGHSPSLAEVTKEGIHKAVEKGSDAAAALLTLSWATTGRPWTWYDVFQSEMKMVPVLQQEIITGYQVAVTWTNHKTVGKRGAFTTHTWLPVELAKPIQRHIANTRHKYLFPKVTWHALLNEVKQLLRDQDPKWDLKCLRRGSLSTMARAGVPLKDLRNFSGHTTDAMLLRYLGWGRHAGVLKTAGMAAAKSLFEDVLPSPTDYHPLA